MERHPGLSRRSFLGRSLAGSSLLAAGALGWGGALARAAALRQGAGANPRKLRLLILGGTGFLGPKTVEVALARGHQVTVFNRGKTEKRIPFGFEGVLHLYGNRDPNLPADDARDPGGALLHPDARPKGLEELEGKGFDVVIDNSGYYPRMVKASAELLAPRSGFYVFISSISAYATNDAVGADEDRPLATLADPTVEKMGDGFANYGGLKVLCEQAAQAAFPGRCAVVRPGYIVGPGDSTDRFTYWPVRIARGGAVALPGSPDDPLQWIDVRDLAEFLVTLAEGKTAGVFNACGPSSPGRFGGVVEACSKHAKEAVEPVWIPADFVEQQAAAGAGVDFPIWIAPKGEYAGFHTWSNDRAEKAGLRFRPLDDTIAALLAWWPEEVDRRRRVTQQMQDEAAAKGEAPPRMGDPEALRAGPRPEAEAKLIAAWREAGAKKEE